MTRKRFLCAALFAALTMALFSCPLPLGPGEAWAASALQACKRDFSRCKQRYDQLKSQYQRMRAQNDRMVQQYQRFKQGYRNAKASAGVAKEMLTGARKKLRTQRGGALMNEYNRLKREQQNLIRSIKQQQAVVRRIRSQFP